MTRADITRAAKAGRLSPLHEISEDRETWRRLRDIERQEPKAVDDADVEPAADLPDAPGVTPHEPARPEPQAAPKPKRATKARVREPRSLDGVPVVAMSLASLGMSLPIAAIVFAQFGAEVQPVGERAVWIALGCAGVSAILAIVVVLLLVARIGGRSVVAVLLALLSLTACAVCGGVMLTRLDNQFQTSLPEGHDGGPGINPAQP